MRLRPLFILKHPRLILYSIKHPNLSDIRKMANVITSEERKKELAIIKKEITDKDQKTFTFRGEEYQYFYGDYNEAWSSERTVEIPIIWKSVREMRDRKILEVGNVLSHYFTISHDVVDKYEVWPGVINEDILTFNSRHRYDLIVSISTLEHIGFSIKRGVSDPHGFQNAISKLISLLKPTGRILFSVPLGYNPFLDNYIPTLAKFSKLTFMRRVSYDNRWCECTYEEAIKCKYGGFKIRRSTMPPYPRANAIIIGEISNAKSGL
ncbi:MAG: hypothetical protein QXV32_03625 [Conexivisphaerales archaeon]